MTIYKDYVPKHICKDHLPKHICRFKLEKRSQYQKINNTSNFLRFVFICATYVVVLVTLTIISFSQVNPFLYNVSRELKSEQITKKQIIKDQEKNAFPENTISYLKKVDASDFQKIINANSAIEIVKLSNNKLNVAQSRSIGLSIKSARRQNTITAFRNQLFTLARNLIIFAIIIIFLFSVIVFLNNKPNNLSWKNTFYIAGSLIKETLVLITASAGLYSIISSNVSVEALIYPDHITYTLLVIPIFVITYTYIACNNILDLFETKIKNFH